MRAVIVGLLFISLLFAEQLDAQYLYFSPTGGCSADGIGCWGIFTEYYIFLSIPGISDAIGASFHIESAVYGPEDFASIDPHEGVIIENGDIFSEITLSWLVGQYVIDTLLTIPIEMNEPHNGDMLVAWTRDVKIYRANGDTLYLDDVEFVCTHCTGFGGNTIWWQHPDTLTAFIGKQSILDIPCIGNSTGGLTGTYLDVFDQLNWIEDCTSCGVGCDCGPCPWDVQHVFIHISVPSDASEGLVNHVRLIPTGPCCLDDSTSFYVKAISETAVEESSWGKIKSLFRKK